MKYNVHFPPAEYGEQSEGREGWFSKQRQHTDKWPEVQRTWYPGGHHRVSSWVSSKVQKELRGGGRGFYPLDPGLLGHLKASCGLPGASVFHLYNRGQYLPSSPPRNTVCADEIMDRSAFSKHRTNAKHHYHCLERRLIWRFLTA